MNDHLEAPAEGDFPGSPIRFTYRVEIDGDIVKTARELGIELPSYVERYASVRELVDDVRQNGYYGGVPRLPLIPVSPQVRLELEAAFDGIKGRDIIGK